MTMTYRGAFSLSVFLLPFPLQMLYLTVPHVYVSAKPGRDFVFMFKK